jgi:hypothetical protein
MLGNACMDLILVGGTLNSSNAGTIPKEGIQMRRCNNNLLGSGNEPIGGIKVDLQLMSDDGELSVAESISYTVSKKSSSLCKSTVEDTVLVQCRSLRHLKQD